MTTLFKKLSITTLTLAIASGIVFSVGSSEPSTFEGQASSIYSVTFNSSNSTFSSDVVTASATQSTTLRKMNIIPGNSTPTSGNFPFSIRTMVPANESFVEFANNYGFEFKNMATISFSTNITGLRVFYSSTETMGGSFFDASTTVRNFPANTNYFSIRYFSDITTASVVEFTITYNC